MRRIAVAVIAAGAVFAAPAVAGTKTVSVGDDFFSPSSLTVKKGTKVKFNWTGEDQHNIVVQSGPKKFQSPLQDSGTYQQKLKKAGTYKLLCTVHAPDMKMTIVVKK